MSFYESITAAVPPAFQNPVTQRLDSLGQLCSQSVSRQWNNGLTAAAALPSLATPDTLYEAWALQLAVWQRLQKQGEQWWNGLAAIGAERGELRRANTLSKFFEQEYNLYAQFGELVSGQFTNLLELMDNIQVDYGYWIAQKVHAAHAATEARPHDGVSSTRTRKPAVENAA
ncbi:hypothetical protein [Jeongeupia chitinilytica]|uniref:Phasin domain-containing protein n=1 Tax=Jeongeupia chitinilytica TaxID=1041641 RepID=A0ABQ3GZ22_9NEIS|nr:hypothetical protein [Jeongeupia chitinilytica]GHD62191.1 hypothetical protein GCM10007350_17770 [Jeongeupia chitinilytica]